MALLLAAASPVWAGEICLSTSPDPFGPTAPGNDAFACGTYAIAFGDASTALGNGSEAHGPFSVAVGNLANAGPESVVMGYSAENIGGGGQNVAIGTQAQTGFIDYGGFDPYDGNASEATALGNRAWAVRNKSTAIGSSSEAWLNAVALGESSLALDYGTALGQGASALAFGSVALGQGSIANRANTVSVGSVGAERQITNVAAGTEATDAANLGQVQDGDAATLAAANDYTDDQIAAAVGDATGASNDYTDSRETAIRNDMTAGDAATLDAANSYTDQQIANVGEIATDAANDYTDQQVTDVRTDMVAGDAATLVAANTHADAGDAATLSSANTYTDTKVAAITLDFSNFRTEVNDRFESQDKRINQVGAMSAAMANMTASAAGVRTRNRVAVGVGNYRGENSLAFGYQRAVSDRAVITIGGAFNGDDSTIGAGAAFGW
jgi:autotransporter adhesin